MLNTKHVLYFALQPPPDVAAEALARLGAARISGRPVAPGRLHVSLKKLGDFKRPPAPMIPKAMEAVAAIRARPFVVEFNRLGTWTRADPPRPVVLWGDEGVIGVEDLYATLHKALARADMAPRRPPEFAPHMTLVYDHAEVRETFVEPVRWTVDEFVLIHAVHGEGRHEVVGRVPLNG